MVLSWQRGCDKYGLTLKHTPDGLPGGSCIKSGPSNWTFAPRKTPPDTAKRISEIDVGHSHHDGGDAVGNLYAGGPVLRRGGGGLFFRLGRIDAVNQNQVGSLGAVSSAD